MVIPDEAAEGMTNDDRTGRQDPTTTESLEMKLALKVMQCGQAHNLVFVYVSVIHA